MKPWHWIIVGTGIAAYLLLRKRDDYSSRFGQWAQKWPFPVTKDTKIPFTWKVITPEQSQYPPELWSEEPLIPRPTEVESLIEYNPRIEELPPPIEGYHWEPLGVPVMYPGITRRWKAGMTGRGLWVLSPKQRGWEPELTEDIVGYPLRRDTFMRSGGKPTVI